MIIARPPAIAVILPRRQRRTKYAVFNVEHRQVLVNDRFEEVLSNRANIARICDQLRSYPGTRRDKPASTNIAAVSSFVMLSE